MRCIIRIETDGKRKTHGWQVRVIRRGIQINEFFSDKRFPGKEAALRRAQQFRDEAFQTLRPLSRIEIARQPTKRNTSGIVGVRRRVKPAKFDGKQIDYVVWTASGSPAPNQRKTRDFYVSKLGEDDAREQAIAQRMKWEREMEACKIAPPCEKSQLPVSGQKRGQKRRK